MNISVQRSTIRQARADGLVIFLRSDKPEFRETVGRLGKILGPMLDQAVKLVGFAAKEGEFLSLFTHGKISAPRLILAGLGESKSYTLERIRRAAAGAVKEAESSGARSLAFTVPPWQEDQPDGIQAVVEGAMLSAYRFDRYISEKKKKRVKTAVIVDPDASALTTAKSAVRESRIICEATILARDLENAPSNEIYPETLAAAAVRSAGKYGYRAQVWEEKKIVEQKFGGLLAVNAGSTRPPRFIVLEHAGAPKDEAPVVLVGKGVTFDTGGISIKPSQGMAEMKMDMSGAAAVIGTLEAAARLQLPVNLIGLIPATENMPSGSAMKPGDIIRHFGGKTSEVDNTDAEGRLILADALAYASSLKPAAVIDLATLTGACVVALGSHATGMMGNDEGLMAELTAAGLHTHERVWPLPFFEEYEKQIKSDVADVKNVGGRWAGAITAGLFLKKFIGEYRWVHLDIAGTAILEEDQPYSPKGGSGVGVRLLIEFLKRRKR